MKTEIDSRTLEFIIWYNKNTTLTSDNVRLYKGVFYYMDRRNASIGGGLEDLWNVYYKENFKGRPS